MKGKKSTTGIGASLTLDYRDREESNNKLKVISVNARSLLNKLDDMQCVASEENPDLTCGHIRIYLTQSLTSRDTV